MDIWLNAPAYFIVFILGASIGSFINVIVYRLPAKLSILWPPSRCPKCLNHLKAYDNVPVFGWLLLKGRCRYCKTKISRRYPLVEALTGITFLIVFSVFQFSISTLGYWAFCSWLLALSLIDFDTMTLPNSLTKSGLIAGLIFQIIVGFFEAGWLGIVKHLMIGIAGAVLGIWLFDTISFIGSVVLGKTAMGAGDAKLAAMMGAWLGWRYLLIAGFFACIVGVLVGSAGIVLKKRNVGEKMPFGPSLALASVITIFSGESILSLYIQYINFIKLALSNY